MFKSQSEYVVDVPPICRDSSGDSSVFPVQGQRKEGSVDGCSVWSSSPN